MSAVRMCDRCGTIFKEGAEGAEIVNGTKNVKDERGRIVSRTVSMDIGPCCAFPEEEPAAPRVALTTVAHEDVNRDPVYSVVPGQYLRIGDMIGFTSIGMPIRQLSEVKGAEHWHPVTAESMEMHKPDSLYIVKS